MPSRKPAECKSPKAERLTILSNVYPCARSPQSCSLYHFPGIDVQHIGAVRHMPLRKYQEHMLLNIMKVVMAQLMARRPVFFHFSLLLRPRGRFNVFNGHMGSCGSPWCANAKDPVLSTLCFSKRRSSISARPGPTKGNKFVS